MNRLLKICMGLLAATAAASSMAQVSGRGVKTTSFKFSTAYTDALLFTSSQPLDDTGLQTALPSSWGVAGGIYRDSLATANEPGEAVVKFSVISAFSSSNQASSYRLTFQQAVAGPFGLILGTVSNSPTNPRPDKPVAYRFNSGFAAGDTFDFQLEPTPAVGVAYVVPSYAAIVGVATPVPEPQAYALMLAGLGAVGFMARRRA